MSAIHATSCICSSPSEGGHNVSKDAPRPRSLRAASRRFEMGVTSTPLPDRESDDEVLSDVVPKTDDTTGDAQVISLPHGREKAHGNECE